MVFIVDADNRRWFEQDLREMYQQRRRVFVEGLGWPLPLAGTMELDQYDAEDVLYLLVKDDPGARLRASVRLLRTDRPHPLLDLFRGLCDAGVPRGLDVWEISRFCTNPGITSRRERLGLLWEIICASLETALLSISSGSRSLPTGRYARWRFTAVGRPSRWAPHGRIERTKSPRSPWT